MARPTLSLVRSIEWGTTYLWDVEFPEMSEPFNNTPAPPPPYNVAFPASAVREPMFIAREYPIQLPSQQFVIPQGLLNSQMNITFYDDEAGTLREWMWEWVNVCFQGGLGIATLKECVRQVVVTRFTKSLVPVSSRKYWVYPGNSLDLEWDSQARPVEISVMFNVVGGLFLPTKFNTAY
jgi:hypothetical protein